MEEFICTRGDIATEKAEEGIEDDDDSPKRAAVAGREEAEECKYYLNVRTSPEFS